MTASRGDTNTPRVLVLYFSATGNTEYAARYLAGRLASQGHESTLVSMEQQPVEELGPFDALIVGFPVYAADTPYFFRAYLHRMPRGGGRPAFAFCTKGFAAGNAPRRALRVLADAGYVPSGSAALGMPGSDGLAFIASDSWMARAALQKDYEHLPPLDRLAARVERTMLGHEDGPGGRLPLSVSGLMFDPVWAALYRVIGRRWRSRLRADDRCRSCGLCARLCPTGSVTAADVHPSFGDGCELCMRCIHSCPQEAVQIGKGTVGKFRWKGPRGDFDARSVRDSF